MGRDFIDEVIEQSPVFGPAPAVFAMARPQRQMALRLLDAALSLRGADQARQIIALESILRETERITG